MAVARLGEPGKLLGAWVRGVHRLHLLRTAAGGALAIGPDLGALLRRCDRVVVLDGDAPVALAASVLIRWRVLEVVLGTPYLPAPDQLRAMFPALRATPGSITIPIGLGSAEEALALCARERVPVVSSRITYGGSSG